MTPKTLRLPKNGEMLMSVHGSPLGVYKEDNLAAIHGSCFCTCTQLFAGGPFAYFHSYLFSSTGNLQNLETGAMMVPPEGLHLIPVSVLLTVENTTLKASVHQEFSGCCINMIISISLQKWSR